MPEITIGLIADTHVPDRTRGLHARVLPLFEQANVSAILHAGDISVPRLLAQLAEVAPVLAVRGNRDLFAFDDLPLSRSLEFGGVHIGLAHGHMGWRNYLRDKLRYLLRGPQTFDFYAQQVCAQFPNEDVVVFGHNHDPMLRHRAGQLVINPGSACCQVLPAKPPSVGLLHIRDGKASAEIAFLD